MVYICKQSICVCMLLNAKASTDNRSRKSRICLHGDWSHCLGLWAQNKYSTSYVYWTVRHLDSWIKRDQLDVTCFMISLFNSQHVSDVNTSILRRLRLICRVISWVVLLWFDVCWCYVVVSLGWCGIQMQAEALLKFKYSTSFCR